MAKRGLAISIACLALVTAGCLLAAPRSATAPTALPSATSPPATTAGPTVTSAPPTLTPPPLPGPCPVPSLNPPAPDLSDSAGTVSGLISYFDAGGAASSLQAAATAAGRWPAKGQPYVEADFNGDRLSDVALVLMDLTPAQAPPRATLYVFLCRESAFALAPFPSGSPTAGLLILHAAQDLTGDGATDLLVGWEECGAHTCYEKVWTLAIQAGQLAGFPLQPTDDLPNPEVALGPRGEVSITGTGIGSVGAGPFRRLTRTWRWDAADKAFVVTSEQYEPSRFRIHVLLDADAAARAGDFETALDLYHQVIVDDSLLEWMDPAVERANLGGYAMFRVMLTYLQIKDEGDAQKAFGILENQYPAEGPGRAYAEMGAVFWEASAAGQDPAAGCRAARAYAESHPTQVLEPLSLGYANPAYYPADICPVGLP